MIYLFNIVFERQFMKKILFSFLTLTLLTSISFASCDDCTVKKDCGCGCKNSLSTPCTKQASPCNKNSMNGITCDKTSPCETKKPDRCSIEDDEYCTYNQCFFDKKFIKLKKVLCLSAKQETCIDTLYKNYKADMEVYHSRYRVQKNKLLEMIECNNDCYKEQISTLKELKKDAKERTKAFRNDIKELLCKDQNKEFRKFQRQEKRKMKKIIKYSCIHKLPCCDCCSK